MNHYIPAILGPFLRQSPFTYFGHHLGMHHPENNLREDLSSTMRFQRDRLDHWLRYFLRFFFLGGDRAADVPVAQEARQARAAQRSRGSRVRALRGGAVLG